METSSTSALAQRPDIDIEEDISQLVRNYAPLHMSRAYLHFSSENGHVRLQGNVRTPQARRVLVEGTVRVAGVRGVDESDLHDDEAVRMSVAPLLPMGIYANVHGGVVSLTGKLPGQAMSDGLIAAVGAVPGVRRVGAVLDN